MKGVVDDKIQADPLDGIFHAANLYRARQISAGPSAGAAQSSLADHGKGRSVGQRAGIAEFFFRELFDHPVRPYDRVITPPVMPADILVQSQGEEPVTDLRVQRMRAVVPERYEHSVLRILQKSVQIGADLCLLEGEVPRHGRRGVFSPRFSDDHSRHFTVFVIKGGQVGLRVIDAFLLIRLPGDCLYIVISVLDPQLYPLYIFVYILDLTDSKGDRVPGLIDPGHIDLRLREKSLGVKKLLVIDIDIGQLDHEIGLFLHLGADLVVAIFFQERIFGGEQICAESQPLSLNSAPQSRQRRRELIDGRIDPDSGGVLRLHGRIDKGRVHFSVILRGNVVAEIAVHGRVVAAQDDRRILIEVLRLYPSDKVRHLPAGAGDRIRVIVARILLAAQVAYISVLKMCVNGQEREVKRLLPRCQPGDSVFCRGEQLAVLHPPEHIVILRNDPFLHGPVIIVDLIAAVLAEIEASSAESRVGPQHEYIFISFVFQDVSEIGHFLKERILRVHLIEGTPLVDEFLPDIDLERKSRRLGKDSSHGEGGSRQHSAAVKESRAARKVLRLRRDLRQLRDVVVGKGPSGLPVRVSGFHGFHVDVDQIPFLGRKSDRHICGIHIVIFDKAGLIQLIAHVPGHVQLLPGVGPRPDHEQNPQCRPAAQKDPSFFPHKEDDDKKESRQP